MQSKAKTFQEDANVETIEKLAAHYGTNRAARGIAASIARTAAQNYAKQKPEDDVKYIEQSVAEIFGDLTFSTMLKSMGITEDNVRDIYKRAIENWKNRHEGVWYEGRFVKEAYPGTGRNEKCPCGSGKKYKKCCGR